MARPQFADLGPDAALDAIEAAGLRPTGHCAMLRCLENRVWDLRIDDGSHVVVKFYRPQRWSRALATAVDRQRDRVRPELGHRVGANTVDRGDLVDGCEWTMPEPEQYDAPGPRWPNAWQGRQFAQARVVDIDRDWFSSLQASIVRARQQHPPSKRAHEQHQGQGRPTSEQQPAARPRKVGASYRFSSWRRNRRSTPSPWLGRPAVSGPAASSKPFRIEQIAIASLHSG